MSRMPVRLGAELRAAGSGPGKVFEAVRTYDDGQEMTALGTGVPASASTPAPARWAAVTIAVVALVTALGSVFVAPRSAPRRGGGVPPA